MRASQIPCDVIHVDAGWFSDGFNCDYKFGPAFPHPKQMISNLTAKGFHTSLWQLPYYTSKNSLFDEIVEKKLCIRNGNHGVPTDDAILDFTNPETVAWYTEKINSLLDLGVSSIKADFGEGAPLKGQYHSGRNGYFEHNLYPLHYTRELYKLVKKRSEDNIIWARSSWAGGQRYPIHWGGDPEVTDFAMAASLRAGLSLGLSGFSFWSHDIGGFSAPPQKELFLRWAFFGLLSSHSRVHGLPPREPWLFDPEFKNTFRQIVEMRYQLMPYLYTQTYQSSMKGHPMISPLFFHFSEDNTAWHIEDQFMLGSSILVAPFFEPNTDNRKVYLPGPSSWIDYQTGEAYKGEQWHKISSHKLPGIILVKNGTIIPHVKLAQCTKDIDWTRIILTRFGHKTNSAKGQLIIPTIQKHIDLYADPSNDETWVHNLESTKIEFYREDIMDRLQ